MWYMCVTCGTHTHGIIAVLIYKCSNNMNYNNVYKDTRCARDMPKDGCNYVMTKL